MSLRLFLCGDVMTGRGIDQALPHPVSPALYEPYVRDAQEYVDLAEKANGPIPRPVNFDYIWGDALQELERGTGRFENHQFGNQRHVGRNALAWQRNSLPHGSAVMNRFGAIWP